jgi:hypothetical protein
MARATMRKYGAAEGGRMRIRMKIKEKREVEWGRWKEFVNVNVNGSQGLRALEDEGVEEFGIWLRGHGVKGFRG